ncbi:MAG: hypothetical protein ACXVJK_05960, partial [Candidatus Aminicenantales bacterium]
MIKTSVVAGRLTLPTLLAVCLLPLFVTGQPAELLRKPQNFERNRDYDALHYKLALELNDKDKSYRGENTITVASLKDDLKSLVFDAEGFAVTEVAGPDGRPLPFTAVNKK